VQHRRVMSADPTTTQDAAMLHCNLLARPNSKVPVMALKNADIRLILKAMLPKKGNRSKQ